MIKLFATDLDGTLISSGNRVKEKDAKAIRKAHEKGAEIVIATGRNYSELPETVTELPVRYFVTANGSELYDREEDRIISNDCLTFAQAKEIMDRGAAMKSYAMYYVGRTVYCSSNFSQYTDKLEEGLSWKILEKNFIRRDDLNLFDDTEKGKIMKIVLLFDSEEERDRARPSFTDLESEIEICASCPDNIEFNPKNVSKGKQIKTLMEILSVKEDEVATMGDGDNDVSMLEITKNSFAPKECTEKVKKTAQTITCESGECAVAEAISILFD